LHLFGFGQLWSTSGQLLPTLDTFGQFWSTLVSFGQLWSILVNFGELWSNFVKTETGKPSFRDLTKNLLSFLFFLI